MKKRFISKCFILLIFLNICLQSFGQRDENNLIQGGIISANNAQLKSNPDSNGIILKHLDFKIPFIITDTKEFTAGRKVTFWYKVVLDDNITIGWINSEDVEIGETDSISFSNGEFAGLYCTAAYNAYLNNNNLELAESLFKDVLERYPDTKILVYDDFRSYSILVNTKLYILKNLAELYKCKKEFSKSIEFYNEVINLDVSELKDVINAEMQIIKIYSEDLKDYQKTIELCHNVIIKYPNQEITAFESNYWVDIKCADIIIDICLTSKDDDLLLSESNKILYETNSPPVILIATSGIAIYNIHKGLFDSLESTILNTLNKYPNEVRVYFTTGCIYTLLPICQAIETFINDNGDYKRAISLLKNVRNEMKDSSLLNFVNYKLAELLYEGNGDKEMVLSAYSKIPSGFYYWDFVRKSEITSSDINNRIDQINACKNSKSVLNQDTEVKEGLRSKSQQSTKVIKGTEVQLLYKDDTLSNLDGRNGTWTKIKLPGNQIGWVFDAYLNSNSEEPLFIQTRENEPIWKMEGANSERTCSIYGESIKEPEIINVIDNVSADEIIFSDVNKDNIPDLLGYSKLGLTAIDGETLKILWIFSCSNGSIPLVDYDLLYITAFKDGKEYFFALDKKTSNVGWKDYISEANYGGIPSSPIIENNTIYVGTRSRGLIAYNKDTGGKIWEFPLDFPIMSSLTFSDKLVYFSSRKDFNDNDRMFAIDASSGNLIWSFDFLTKNNFYHNQGTAIFKEKLICAGGNDYLYALDSKTGKLIWKTQVRATGGQFASYRPVVYKGTVYFTTPDNGIYAVNAETGIVKWTYEYAQPFAGRPALVNDLLYIRSIDSNIHALSLADGSSRWKLKLGSDAFGGDYSISIEQGKIFVSSTDNKIYVIGEKSISEK